MDKRAQTILSLLAVLALATALTAAVSGRVVARSTFQSPPPSDAQSPLTPTLATPPLVPTVTLPASVMTPAPLTPLNPGETPPPGPPMPEPVVPALTAAAPAVPGFLPAPTLTDPEALRRNPPAIYQPARPQAPVEPTAEPAPTPVTLAGLLREGIVALSYLWLCLGLLLLAGVAAAIVWLTRRTLRQ